MAAEEDTNVWEYDPSLGASILFTTIWFATTTGHIIQMIQYRKWYCWTLCMGCLWTLVGFSLRNVSIKNPDSVPIYAPMLTFIILAPIWIAAYVYMSLGRLVLRFTPSKCVFGVSARWITLLFVLGDIVSFLVQMSGSMLLTGDDPSPEQFRTGSHILIGGQALQLVLFTFFVVMSVRFLVTAPEEERHEWRRFLKCLHVSCAAISVRCIFRIAEFASEYPGPLVRHEAPFYLLDTLMMTIAVVVFHWEHPGNVLVGEESSFRAQRRKRKLQVVELDGLGS